MGIHIVGRNITNLRYTDDTALMANDITCMIRILYRVDAEAKPAGLKLNAKKAKVMRINSKVTSQNIVNNGTNLDPRPYTKLLPTTAAMETVELS